MSGEHDPLYVRARAALLDTLDALEPHLDALVLVGAQAIYLHTSDANLAVAQYTTDADFSVSPGELSDTPLLGDLLTARGFLPREHPGGWLSPDGIYVDVMVPEALAGPGSRGARLGPHGKRAARRAKGLEGAAVDRERSVITALDPSDDRAIEMWIAGPSVACCQDPQDRRAGRCDGSRPRQGRTRRSPPPPSRRDRRISRAGSPPFERQTSLAP